MYINTLEWMFNPEKLCSNQRNRSCEFSCSLFITVRADSRKLGSFCSHRKRRSITKIIVLYILYDFLKDEDESMHTMNNAQSAIGFESKKKSGLLKSGLDSCLIHKSFYALLE